jgi:xylulokinase
MICTCDIGTSSLKLGVINDSGGLVWYAREHLENPDARLYKHLFTRLTGKIPGGMRNSLSAVCISGNGPTLIPLDKKGNPTDEPLLWQDRDKQTDLPFPSRSYFLPKVLWFIQNRPRSYEKTQVFLPVGEYIAFLLTGNRAVVLPHQGFRGYYWEPGEISKLKIDKNRFPPFLYLNDEIGKITPQAAHATRLPPRLPVFSGGTDFIMSLLGTGSIRPGLANDRGGTSEAVNCCSEKPVVIASLRLVPGFQAGTYNLGGFIDDAGRLHAWLKEKLIGRNGSYEEFALLAADIIPGSSNIRFIPPKKTGSRSLEDLHFRDLFSGVDSDTSKGEYARAFWEYLGFAVRSILEELGHWGMAVTALRCSGGLAKCAALNKIKASIIGRTLMVGEIPDAELLGNAIVAATACGRYSSFAEAVEKLVRFPAEYMPEPAYSALYDDLYEEFKEKKGIFHENDH